MKDIGHDETDAILGEIEKKVRREYAQAVKDTQAKLDDYLRRFEAKNKKWQKWVADGKRTEAEYKEWRKGQIMMGKRWEEMRDTLAQDYHNANEVARSIVDGYKPEVYALNHNYATFTIEHDALVDTSYTLYNRDAAERILRDNPDLLPTKIGKRTQAELSKALAKGKDLRWQAGQIQSVTLQSILQGESITHMARRIAQTMGETNHASTIRYARTAMTGAENAGRQAAYERAQKLGLNIQREWLATLDGRTRHEHRMLDGQVRGLDEPFEVDGYKINYPGDPTAEGHLIWNCRCRLEKVLKNFEIDPTDLNLRYTANMGDMTYEEWKNAKAKSNPITLQEEKGKAIRGSYYNRYRRG